MKPNLFIWATSELSQDAFLCWLLDWANPSNREIDAGMHTTAGVFLDSLMTKYDLKWNASDVIGIKIYKQKRHIDVWAEIETTHGKYALLIEDKTSSHHHSGQLDRYLSYETDIHKDNVLAFYFKTVDGSDYRSVLDAGFVVYDRADFLNLRPFLETVTNVHSGQLSLMLLAMGGSGLIGTFLIGHIINRGLYFVLGVFPLLMAIIAIALTTYGYSVGATYVLLFLWGLLGTSAPTAWWTWVSKILPHEAEAGGSLMVAIVQLAIITMGAAGGGLLFDASGYCATFMASAAILIVAAIMAWATKRSAVKTI